MKSKPKHLKIAWFVGRLGGRGVTVVVEQAAKAVASLSDHEINIVCVHSLPEDYPEIPSVRIHNLRLPWEDKEASCRGAYQWITTNSPDVVLFNDTPPIEPLWPYLPSEVKTIGVLHDIAWGWRKPFVDYRHSLNGIAAVSDFVHQSIAAQLSDFKGIFNTIDNGTDYPAATDRSAHNNPLRLLFFGAIDRQKGTFDLPAIVRKLSDFNFRGELLIIGGHSMKIDKKLLPFKNRIPVRWLGKLPREHCFQKIATCDILLSLGRSESFGLVTVEAMAMGCLPVGFNSGGTASIVENNKSGLLVPLCNYDKLCKQIINLDHDRNRLATMQRKASERARTDYSSAAMGQRYLTMIEQVIANEQSVERLDFGSFKLPPQKYRRYATLVPLPFRKMISELISLSPRLENLVRRYKGI